MPWVLLGFTEKRGCFSCSPKGQSSEISLDKHLRLNLDPKQIPEILGARVSVW